MTTHSIATILAVSFGTLVVIAISLVLFVGFWTARNNTVAATNDRAVLFINLIETHLNDILEPARHQVQYFQKQLDTKTVRLEDDERFADMMKGALAAAPQITAIIFWDTDLKQSTAFVDVDGSAAFTQTDWDGDTEVKERLEEARNHKTTYWGKPLYAEETASTYIDLIHPLYLGGEFVGFFAVIISISDLSRIIAEIGERFETTAFILYGEDRVLAHPNLRNPRNDLSQDSPTVRLDRIGDPVLGHFPNRRPIQAFEEALTAGVHFDVIESGGVFHATIYGRLETYGDTPWLVGTHLPVDRTNDEVRRAIRSGIAGLIVLVVAVVGAVFLGRRLAEPIRRMAVGAAQVSTLELSSVAPLPPSRIRELHEQAHAFNSMLNGLKWFETYVPKKLVKKLIAREDQVALTSTEKQATILFTDIVGFTALSETLSPPEVAALLNHHFDLLSGCVETEQGTIDKFIGDALMAFWNAPDDQDDHAAKACRAALAIADAIRSDNAKRGADGLPPIRVRMGIHTGPVVVGNIGAPGRINYTIVGDTVNAAQRLEALGKELAAEEDVLVLASAATKAAARSKALAFESLGTFEVRGKSETLEVFRLIASESGRR